VLVAEMARRWVERSGEIVARLGPGKTQNVQEAVSQPGTTAAIIGTLFVTIAGPLLVAAVLDRTWWLLSAVLVIAATLGVIGSSPFKKGMRHTLDERAQEWVDERYLKLESLSKNDRLSETDKLESVRGALELENRLQRIRFAETIVVALSLVVLAASSVAIFFSDSQGSSAPYILGALIIASPYLGLIVNGWLLRRMDGDARALHDLAELLAILEGNPDKWSNPRFKRLILDRLEEAARSIHYYFARVAKSRDRTTRWAIRLEGDRRAEGIRDYKWLPAFPAQTTFSDLKAELANVLSLISRGLWDQLPRKEPRYRRPTWRRVAVSVLMVVLGLSVAAAMVLLIINVADRENDETIKALQGVFGAIAAAALTIVVAFALRAVQPRSENQPPETSGSLTAD
jgi:hypothetical protein